MSDPISLAGQIGVAQGTTALDQIAPVPGTGSGQDLERLKSLVQEHALKAETTPNPPVNDVTEIAVTKAPGDAILEGIAGIKDTYETHLSSIEDRLTRMADTGSLDLGNQFSETLGLQLDIAQWSMSVMGVDNSAKAGTNTIKELSKGA